jgi:BRCT domain type II-containing protein
MAWHGKRIAFTGIATHHTRDQIRLAIQSAGATWSDAVNGKTDLLVLGENPGNGVRKREQAQRLHVPMVTASEFMRIALAGMPDWPFGGTVAHAKPVSTTPAPAVTVAIDALAQTDAFAGFVGF